MGLGKREGRKCGSRGAGGEEPGAGAQAGARGASRGRPYLVILVGGHGDEGGLGEDVGAEGRVFGAEPVVLVCLHDVEPGLVFVHGVQDDLEEKQTHGGVRPGAPLLHAPLQAWGGFP